jgi:hypothetical protein
MRGRGGGGGGGGNNNMGGRKGPNPLSRNYESNGPDVKIRGSAQQIAEKYATLARDAQSSGDRVMAENYLQHAEHYNRIIAAAQAQFAPQQVQAPREEFEEDFEAGYGPESGGETHAPAQPQHHHGQPAQQNMQPVQVNGSGPQPVIEGMPAEVALNNENVGQQTGGGRHRRRFEHRNQVNGAGQERGEGEQPPVQSEGSDQPAEVPAPAEAQAQGAEDSAQEQPKRARRPRRSRKSETGEQQDAAADASASDAATDAGGETSVVPAEA